MSAWTPTPRQMERIKQRLGALHGLLGPGGRVALAGGPAAADLDGQLRLEGVSSLLRSGGRSAVSGAWPGRPAEAAIWLGDRPPAAPPRLAGGPWLLWPRADIGERDLAGLVRAAGGTGLLCVADPGWLALVERSGGRGALLPEPAHALWGLLDHHPAGQGRLRVVGEAGWDGLLPADRVALLARAEAARAAGLPLGRATDFARCRLVEGARRLVAAHAEVEADRIGPGLLAALLGRGLHAAGEGRAGILGYWAEWTGAAPALEHEA